MTSKLIKYPACLHKQKRDRDKYCDRGSDTERQRDRDRDRETERQRDRETERQRDRETERQRDIADKRNMDELRVEVGVKESFKKKLPWAGHVEGVGDE